MQRLFSTFADGWPGLGLLLQRLLAAIALFHYGISHLSTTVPLAAMLPHIIGAGGGAFLLVGLWTPVVGTVVAIVEMWVAVFHGGEPWIAILSATLGGTLAMIGPGAWSIDARLYGRKYIETPER